jgi:hypothetical protein
MRFVARFCERYSRAVIIALASSQLSWMHRFQSVLRLSEVQYLFSIGSGAHRNEENLDGSLHQIVSPIAQLCVNTVLIRLFGER